MDNNDKKLECLIARRPENPQPGTHGEVSMLLPRRP